ncbi:MAG TPA: ribonuclease P protein component [Actinomycetota bacterium]
MDRLRRDKDFKPVLDRGQKLHGRLLIAHVLTGQTECKVGFIAGRRVGGAVLRNRARRLMREAWRGTAGLDRVHVVFVARAGITKAKTADVAADLQAALATLGANAR